MAIEIKVKAGNNKNSSFINASGTNMHIITKEEQALFGLDDSSIKEAVKTYFGKKPNDVFLHSATPWKDLYKTYHWPEVQTVLAIQEARILEVTSEPVIVAEHKLSNTSSQVAVLDASISQQVEVTAESNWSKTDEIGVSQSIEYGVELPGAAKIGGSTTFSYNHAFGEGGAKSKAITVGSSAGASVSLYPGEAVKVSLTATRGVMRVQVIYNLYLAGCIAVNYTNPFKEHHFHALDIHSVLEAAGIPTTREYVEDIEIGFYSKANTEVKDMGGKQKAMPVSSLAMASV